MTEKEIEREKVRENIEEIIRNSHDWLTTMKELCELQYEKACEDKEDEYPMEIVGFEDRDGAFNVNPFLDESCRFELVNPIDEYGVENVKTFFHEMNEVIGQYVTQLDSTNLQWNEEKNSKEIDIYCCTMAKYELTDESIETEDGTQLYRIRALKDFSDVKKGDLGGYVEKEENLSHAGDCWVYDNAWVYDDAEIYENAKIYGNVKVYGDAEVCKNASVYGNSKIYEYATIFGNAIVYGNPKIGGSAKVYGNAEVFENAKVYECAKVFDKAKVYGNAEIYVRAKVCEYAEVFDKAKIYGDAEVYGNAKIGGSAMVFNDAKVGENAEVYGRALIYDNAEVYGNAKINNNMEICGTTKID